MISSKRYVEEDSQGALRVGSLGVSLDSVVIAFQQGHSAETIEQLYPALSLEEVYGAIAFYLANRVLELRFLTPPDQIAARYSLGCDCRSCLASTFRPVGVSIFSASSFSSRCSAS